MKKIVSGFDTIIEDIIYTRSEKIVSRFRYFINNNKKRKIASGFDTIVKEMIDIQRDLNILFFKKKKRKKEKKSGFDNIMEEIIYTFAHWRDT